MSHYAKVVNGVVKQVIKAEQDVIDSGMLGDPDIWIQTSYNTRRGVHSEGGIPLRMNFAMINGAYDSVRDAFIPVKPFPSWVLNELTCNWAAPVAHPNDGKIYEWNESTISWSEMI